MQSRTPNSNVSDILTTTSYFLHSFQIKPLRRVAIERSLIRTVRYNVHVQNSKQRVHTRCKNKLGLFKILLYTSTYPTCIYHIETRNHSPQSYTKIKPSGRVFRTEADNFEFKFLLKQDICRYCTVYVENNHRADVQNQHHALVMWVWDRVFFRQ